MITTNGLARLLSLSARALIRVYRYSLSSVIGRTCRHLPTCSEYTDEAIGRFGLWAGGWMGLARLSRCRPGGSHGFDPVPVALAAGSGWYAPWRYGLWRGGAVDKDERAEHDGPDLMEAAMARTKPAFDEAEEFRAKVPGEDPAYDAWFKEQVQIGIDQIERGELISNDDVEREWQTMRADLLRRIAAEK